MYLVASETAMRPNGKTKGGVPSPYSYDLDSGLVLGRLNSFGLLAGLGLKA
jgi:hypothetical protein